MKYVHLFFFLFSCVFSMAQGQAKSTLENVVITYDKNKSGVLTSPGDNGEGSNDWI